MLKFWAAFFMLLDHFGFFLQPLLPDTVYVLLRAIGRLAFPIFAYSIARGYTRTRNPSRYFVRLLTFAVLSEILIRLGLSIAGLTMHWTNVLFTFTLSLAMISGYRLLHQCGKDLIASLRPIPAGPGGLRAPSHFDVRVNIFGIELDARIGAMIGIILIIGAMATASMIQSDYDIYGLLTVLCFYIALERRDEKDHSRTAIILLFILNTVFFIQRLVDGTPFEWAFLQNLSLLAVPFIFLAKPEKRPGPVVKYFFYVFYLLHIFLLLVLRSILI